MTITSSMISIVRCFYLRQMILSSAHSSPTTLLLPSAYTQYAREYIIAMLAITDSVDHLEIIRESAEKRSTIERELRAIKKRLTKVGGHESGI